MGATKYRGSLIICGIPRAVAMAQGEGMIHESTRGDLAFPALPEAWERFLGVAMIVELGVILAKLATRGEHYPPKEDIFRAFELCLPDQVRVVVVGQDPYHGPGEAHGLAFSVLSGTTPPSLRSIFKEMKSDLGWSSTPAHGDLSAWSRQGVLLLNSILTVAPNRPGSHADLGWEEWTEKALARISQSRPDAVFVLWGAKAHKKKRALAAEALILEGAHPSPLSANRGGFFGERYFSRANKLLASRNAITVDWGAILQGPTARR